VRIDFWKRYATFDKIIFVQNVKLREDRMKAVFSLFKGTSLEPL
jgi:hypothetical protein